MALSPDPMSWPGFFLVEERETPSAWLGHAGAPCVWPEPINPGGSLNPGAS